MCFYGHDWYPQYLKTFISSGFFVDQMSEQLVGIQPNFGSTHLSRIYIPIPPLEEQKEIVKVVETLFKEVEQLEQLTVARIGLKEDYVTSALQQLTANSTNQEWTNLQDHFKSFFNETTNIKKLRETILQLAVQGKLTADWRSSHPNTEDASQLLKRIQEEKAQLIADKKIKKEKALPPITEDEIPYELPDGWVWCRLQEIIKISSGKGLTSANMDKTGNIPVYGGNGITGYHNLGNVEKPTIVIGRVGYYCGSIHLTEANAWVTDNAFVTKYSEENIYRDFLLWLLRGTNLKEDENATAQPVISGRKVYPIIIALPPYEEQIAIVEKVNSLMGLCDALEQEVQQSQQHSEMMMQSVLKEVFEGGKEVVV
ncbi:type I restriction-modification system specificity subunit S [Nonlabens ulvanivorans]|nr:type I restriction-modification system specificity subunit S [Nonlabens ulvanivorans]